MHRDRCDVPIRTSSAEAAAHFDAFGEAVLAHCRSAPGHLAAALEADPRMVIAHAAKGLSMGLMAQNHLLPAMRRELETARTLMVEDGGGARESLYVEALGAWVAGDWLHAARALGEAMRRHPHDGLAIKLGHGMRFMLGDAAGMRAELEWALPRWSAAVPTFGYILGCHAFALEETGDYAEAEATGRKAVEMQPRDAWGLHAVAHVMEMQGRPAEGLAWFDAHGAEHAHCNNFDYHIWWHRALFELELDRPEAALALYDARIRPERTDDFRDVANGASMLWRLEHAGLDVGDRWQELADTAAGHRDDHALVFADAHYALSLVGAGRLDEADALIASARAASAGSETTQGARLATLGLPLLTAIRQAGAGDTAAAVDRLTPALGDLPQLGGSHAQRDVFLQLYTEAALDARRFDRATDALAARARRRAPGLWGGRAERAAARGQPTPLPPERRPAHRAQGGPVHRVGALVAAAVLAVALTLLPAGAAEAEAEAYPYDGIVEIATPHDFDTLWERLAQAVRDHEMFLVGQASASRAAAGRGVDIPGNGVIEVFRNDFAVRMLEASVPAGIEAPIRFYLTENPDGTTTLTYRRPSAVFAPYDGAGLDAMAAELDTIFAAIAEQAAE
jgi:uncharacterized protein (DUF302 family)/tetratricopeptide (TPR) repeat protein